MPIQWPASFWDRVSDGFAETLLPWLKNVARAPAERSAPITWLVELALGPSSKVSATYPERQSAGGADVVVVVVLGVPAAFRALRTEV
nr:hypothetical protein GCM10017745_43690 [Saccharothrix mutabilis subsp. capreolus]